MVEALETKSIFPFLKPTAQFDSTVPSPICALELIIKIDFCCLGAGVCCATQLKVIVNANAKSAIFLCIITIIFFILKRSITSIP